MLDREERALEIVDQDGVIVEEIPRFPRKPARELAFVTGVQSHQDRLIEVGGVIIGIEAAKEGVGGFAGAPPPLEFGFPPGHPDEAHQLDLAVFR